jgi:hypothetical protein
LASANPRRGCRYTPGRYLVERLGCGLFDVLAFLIGTNTGLMHFCSLESRLADSQIRIVRLQSTDLVKHNVEPYFELFHNISKILPIKI